MNKENTDCYFFYNSTCDKGDECPYRHCIQALGKNNVCKYWSKNMCERQNCPFRHTNNLKIRSQTACYYEKQEGGCMKPHCTYLHQKPRSKLFEAIERNDDSVILPVRSSSTHRYRNTSTSSTVASSEKDSGNDDSDSELEDEGEAKVLAVSKKSYPKPKEEKVNRTNVLMANLKKVKVSENHSSETSAQNSAKKGPSHTIPTKQDLRKSHFRTKKSNPLQPAFVKAPPPFLLRNPPPPLLNYRHPHVAAGQPVFMTPHHPFGPPSIPLAHPKQQKSQDKISKTDVKEMEKKIKRLLNLNDST